MPNQKKFRSLYKKTIISALLCGLGYITYQIKSTLDILNSTIDTNTLDYFENKQRLFKSNYIIIQPEAEKSSSLYDRFWDAITFSYARRLLGLAQSDQRHIRLRAVKSLAQIHNLDDWHYSLLAHMCDDRTAIGLARSENVDLRYFIHTPHTVTASYGGLTRWLQNFMLELNKICNHPCLSYFIEKKFVNLKDLGHFVEHDIGSSDIAQCIICKEGVVPAAIESLLHHSSLEDNAKDIAKMNGLPLLMELYKKNEDNIDIVITLVNIISNMSIHCDLLHDIYSSGWITVLAELLKSDDIRISGPVAKTLANLDIDDHLGEKYERKVYLLHPIFRTNQNFDVDIILIHGLLGGVFFTWRQRDRIRRKFQLLGKEDNKYRSFIDAKNHAVNDHQQSSDPRTRTYLQEVEEHQQFEWDQIGKDYEIIYHDLPTDIHENETYSCSGEDVCFDDPDDYTQCWPKDWLPRDCSNLRILGINYETSLSRWAPMCPSDNNEANTLETRSQEILEKLSKVGVGERPIIWLTHSMGGLVAKNILTKAWESEDENLKKICRNTKGVIFCSTPHRGSHAASLNQTTSLFLWPSVEVQELKEGSPTLLKLHENFLNMLKEVNIKILSFVETESTSISPLHLQIQFVRDYSAHIDVGEYYEIPLDHPKICKPATRTSFIYQKILAFVQKIIDENDVKMKTVN